MSLRSLASLSFALFAFVAPAFAAGPEVDDSVQGAFARQVQRCWKAPRPEDGAKLSAKVRIVLGKDGTVVSGPTVLAVSEHPFGPVLVTTVYDAIKSCAPYQMPASNKEQRMTLDLVFTTERL